MRSDLNRVAEVQLEQQDAVYFDAVNGIAGTAWPIGTIGTPVNNEANLWAILTARNADRVVLRNPGTTLQFTSPLANVTFIAETGAGVLSPTVDFNGQAITCTFINLRITDTTGSNLVSPSEFWGCHVVTVIADTVTGTNYHGCRFDAGGVTNPPGGTITLYDCQCLGDLSNTTGTITAFPGLYVAGSLNNTTGNIYVNGNCEVVNTISQTGGGSIAITGDCQIGNSLTKTAGGLNIGGDCRIGNALANTGTVGIQGDCTIGNDLTNAAGGSTVTFYGKCTTGNDLVNGAGSIVTFYGDGKIGNDLTNAGIVVIRGNCKVDNTLSSAAGGNVQIYGDCTIGNNLNATGTVGIHGDCTVVNSITAIAGTGAVDVGGDCKIGNLLKNATGWVGIERGCEVGGGIQQTGAGIINVGGDCKVWGNIDQTGVGTILIGGKCQVSYDVSNKGSLTGGIISFTASAPTLDLLLGGATSVTERVVSRGSLTVAKLAAGATAIIDLSSGTLTIAASCTGGTIDLYGDCDILDLAAGAVTINDHRTGQQDTRFFQETAPATNANGTNWVDLLDRSAITKPVRICGFMVTVAGGWAGNAKVRIVDGAGTTKLFPFQAEYVEATDFTSGVQATLNFPLEVSVAKGYKLQFRSSAGGDGVGKTLALNNLAVQELS